MGVCTVRSIHSEKSRHLHLPLGRHHLRFGTFHRGKLPPRPGTLPIFTTPRQFQFRHRPTSGYNALVFEKH